MKLQKQNYDFLNTSNNANFNSNNAENELALQFFLWKMKK